jgi:hypothetical protein
MATVGNPAVNQHSRKYVRHRRWSLCFCLFFYRQSGDCVRSQIQGKRENEARIQLFRTILFPVIVESLQVETKRRGCYLETGTFDAIALFVALFNVKIRREELSWGFLYKKKTPPSTYRSAEIGIFALQQIAFHELFQGLF